MPDLHRRAYVQPGADAAGFGQVEAARVVDMGDDETDFVDMPAQQHPVGGLRVHDGDGIAAGIGELGMGERLAVGKGLLLDSLLVSADGRGGEQIFQEFSVHMQSSFL